MSPVRLYTIGNNYFVIAGNGGAAARNLSRTRAGGEGRRGGGGIRCRNPRDGGDHSFNEWSPRCILSTGPCINYDRE